MPHTSTKHPAASTAVVSDSHESSNDVVVNRARKRIRDGYYDRPEIRRTLAALILRRAVRIPGRSKTP